MAIPVKETYTERYREWAKTTVLAYPVPAVVELLLEADKEIADLREVARRLQTPPGVEDYTDVE